jgi:hypothetical protein
MQMDHALRVAAGPVAEPDDILSTAERLLRPGPAAASRPGLRTGPPPDNQATLRACQDVLKRTLDLLR